MRISTLKNNIPQGMLIEFDIYQHIINTLYTRKNIHKSTFSVTYPHYPQILLFILLF